MKVKKKATNKSKLLRLKLIKTKIYNHRYASFFSRIENIEHRLKKNFQIIHKYHTHKKRILFIGSFSSQKMKRLIEDTPHKFLTYANYYCGKITNKKHENWAKKYNLIVILNSLASDKIIKESYKAKTPIIFFSDKKAFISIASNYKVLGNFSFSRRKIKDYLFLNLLKVVLEKKNVTSKKK